MIDIKTPEGIQRPDPSTKIWRYFSFPRFKQFVENKNLYLARIDQFSDFVEGNMSGRSIEESRLELHEQGDDGQVANALVAMTRRLSSNTTYAVCWNMSERESNLMWRAYGQIPSNTSTDHAFKVAVSTTIEKLHKSLEQYTGLDSDRYYLGIVDYIDDGVSRSPQDVVTKAFTKRTEYEDEKECRFAIHRPSNMPSGLLSEMPQTEKGILLPLEVDDLIECIYVEPPSVDQIQLGLSGTTPQDEAYANKIHYELNRRMDLVSALVNSRTGIQQVSTGDLIVASRIL